MVIDVSGSTVLAKMAGSAGHVYEGNVLINQNVHVRMDSKDQCVRHQCQQNDPQLLLCQGQQQQELPHQELRHRELLHQNKQDQQDRHGQHCQLSGDHGPLGPNVTIGSVMKSY